MTTLDISIDNVVVTVRHERRGGDRMTTIRTVAARAGVSIKTVSRVFNDPAAVAEPTRLRVQAVMEELNFVPDQRARAMRSGRSGVVGFLTDVIATTPYSVDIVRGAEDALAERGISLLI